MKNRKLTVLVLGTILIFSVPVTGCAGKDPGEVNSAVSQGQESAPHRPFCRYSARWERFILSLTDSVFIRCIWRQ